LAFHRRRPVRKGEEKLGGWVFSKTSTLDGGGYERKKGGRNHNGLHQGKSPNRWSRGLCAPVHQGGGGKTRKGKKIRGAFSLSLSTARRRLGGVNKQRVCRMGKPEVSLKSANQRQKQVTPRKSIQKTNGESRRICTGRRGGAGDPRRCLPGGRGMITKEVLPEERKEELVIGACITPETALQRA